MIKWIRTSRLSIKNLSLVTGIRWVSEWWFARERRGRRFRISAWDVGTGRATLFSMLPHASLGGGEQTLVWCDTTVVSSSSFFDRGVKSQVASPNPYAAQILGNDLRFVPCSEANSTLPEQKRFKRHVRFEPQPDLTGPGSGRVDVTRTSDLDVYLLRTPQPFSCTLATQHLEREQPPACY